MRNTRYKTAVLGTLTIVAACSASSSDPFAGSGLDRDNRDPGDIGSGGNAGAGSGGEGNTMTVPDDGGGATFCNPGLDEDWDNDGWTIRQGDCDDCNRAVNPGAYDDPTNERDDDCDGQVDNASDSCDIGLLLGDGDPLNAAKAIGLCRVSTPTQNGLPTWGVISAKYVKADGSAGIRDIQHGLVGNFGAALVWEGERMLVLSTGVARAPGQLGFQSGTGINNSHQGSMPPYYPKPSNPPCTVLISQENIAYDSAGLELSIRVPTNALSFSYLFNFYTHEFPEYICSEWNDYFVALLTPKPAGVLDGNISFDTFGNPVTVNNGFLDVCTSRYAGGKFFECTQGPGLLAGTGFDSTSPPGASTGWLKTSTNVEPGGVITIRLAIWDTGDHIFDSTVLIDKFEWLTEAIESTQTEPIIR